MTKQERRYAQYIKRGYFLSECKRLSTIEPKDAPWLASFRKARTSIVKKWSARMHRSLENETPKSIRESLTYVRMVRAWYLEHGWTKERTREGKRTFRIDTFAATRHYADIYQTIEGTAYMPPWRKRQATRRERMAAIDKRFDASLGIGINVSNKDLMI